jgi:hypothetical protein
MRPAPHWRPGQSAGGSYRDPMVQCAACGYNSWRTAACAFCGAPFETPSDETSQAGPPRAPADAPSRPVEAAGGFPSLFLLWFLLGLLVGIVGFSPRARAAGALFWPGAERFQGPARQNSAIGSPVPLAWRDPEPDRGAPETQ